MMDRDELREGMADYLGQELEVEGMARYKAALVDHPDLAEEVAALQKTLSMIHETAVPHPGPDRALAGRPRRTWQALAAAAALVLAFLLGYLSHPGGSGSGDTRSEQRIMEIEKEAVVQSWQVDAARAYSRPSSGSGLARSLVAFSHALGAKR